MDGSCDDNGVCKCNNGYTGSNCTETIPVILHIVLYVMGAIAGILVIFIAIFLFVNCKSMKGQANVSDAENQLSS